MKSVSARASKSTWPGAALLILLALAVGAIAVAPPATHGGPSAQAAASQRAAQRPAIHAPGVQAKSAYLLDLDTGEVLFQKFPTTRRPMASTTKLMTGLLAAESGRLEEIVTVSPYAASIGETTMGLAAGERVSLNDLLYGLMMNSGNDAAGVLAEHLAGSVPAFADQMNARAAEMGLWDTHFVNPHGIDVGRFFTTQHFSSARDLALLGAAALWHPVLAGPASMAYREVAGPPGKEPHYLRHTLGALWWYPGVIGGKTGWTERSGQVRVVGAERGGTRLVAVVMDSPDNVPEIRDLLDYGFTVDAKSDAGATAIPLNAEAFSSPEAALQQAWQAYKQLALTPEGRIRTGANGDGATSEAQANALLHAVWFRDRAAFDAMWGWTKTNLSRRQASQRDALFAGRWQRGAVTDWANATGADERAAAALLLASRLWNEKRYQDDARPILDALLNKAAFAWDSGMGLPAANSALDELEPVTTSATSLTPAFYRMFAEGSRNGVWSGLLDGTYATLRQAAADGPLGPGAGLLPGWFSATHDKGTVGAPIDPSWQSTGFADVSPALVWQLALDAQWNGDARAKELLAPTARLVASELAQRGRVAAAYSRAGAAASANETTAYGALAGVALPDLAGADPKVRAALEGKLRAALASKEPDRILDAIGGLWMLAGGPPNYWRIFWPPEDLPTTRSDDVVPPEQAGYPWRYFVETGHVVRGPFLDYFGRNGGVTTFGLPRTDELTEDGRLVQYFQRGRLEYAPERAGAEIALAALGTQSARARGVLQRPEAKPTAPYETDDTHAYIPEAGHGVSGGFKAFYEKSGGAAVLGYPLTEELNEDGFTVQYFERVVLEFVPGKPVQAELLGDDLLRQKGWLK